MNNCYICLEDTFIYYKNINCNCLIYCHEKCFDNIKNNNKCILCRKNTKLDLDTIIYRAIEKTLLFRFINLIYDNFIFNFLINISTYIHFGLFVIYSILASLLLLLLSIFIILLYCSIYIYYNKYTNHNNFNKFFIKN
jgi:hypothetical protein